MLDNRRVVGDEQAFILYLGQNIVCNIITYLVVMLLTAFHLLVSGAFWDAGRTWFITLNDRNGRRGLPRDIQRAMAADR